MAEGYPRSYAQYVLLERLGTGGMSEVDLARKVVDGESFVRFLVVKRIRAGNAEDPQFVRMFKDEARITSELHHANIGAVYDFGKVDDEYYLALEYVPGMDLRLLIHTLRERSQRVPVRIALKITVEILEALEHAHTRTDTFGRPMGIVHRDVNPRNVMLSIRGEVKLIDFGVARAADRLEQTRTDHVKGKYVYMAPEQLTGKEFDHRADVYAAGLVLHELLSGVSPFYGLNHVQVVHRMMSGAVPAMPEVPEMPDASALKRIHQRLLANDPAQRYPSASAAAVDLRAVAATVGGVPGNDKLAAFVAAVDPELEPRLLAKMAGYARSGEGSGEGPPPTFAPVAPLSRPLPKEESGSLSVTRTGLLAGSVMVLSVGSVAGGALVLVLIVALVFLASHPWSAPAEPPAPIEAPEPVAAAPAAPEPALVPAAPAPAPVAAPPRPHRPGPGAPDPAPVPEPVAEPVAVEPVPVEPAPVEPAAAPVPVEYGLVNVGAPLKGREVRLGGQRVGATPLARLKMPVGTYPVEVEGYTCAPTTVTVLRNQVANVCA